MTMLPSGGMVNGFRPGNYQNPSGDNGFLEPGNVNQSLPSNGIDFSSMDSILLAMQDRANSGDSAALDWLLDYYAKTSADKTARDWTAAREDTAYQRLMADLSKAGISPYILTGATPFASSANASSVSSGHFTSKANSERTALSDQKDRANQFNKMMFGLIGTALVVMAHFL